jgi:hypothetical protein
MKLVIVTAVADDGELWHHHTRFVLKADSLLCSRDPLQLATVRKCIHSIAVKFTVVGFDSRRLSFQRLQMCGV